MPATAGSAGGRFPGSSSCTLPVSAGSANSPAGPGAKSTDVSVPTVPGSLAELTEREPSASLEQAATSSTAIVATQTSPPNTGCPISGEKQCIPRLIRSVRCRAGRPLCDTDCNYTSNLYPFPDSLIISIILYCNIYYMSTRCGVGERSIGTGSTIGTQLPRKRSSQPAGGTAPSRTPRCRPSSKIVLSQPHKVGRYFTRRTRLRPAVAAACARARRQTGERDAQPLP